MGDFTRFAGPVREQFNKMTTGRVFCADVERDALWDHYLASFPEGSNPIFRKRTENDCSCCRGFVKNAGGVVTISDGKLQTIWDVKVSDPAYQAVADAMAAFVKTKAIRNIFLHPEKHIGLEKNFEKIEDEVNTWNHFYVTIPGSNSGDGIYCKKDDVATKLGKTRSARDVWNRALTELTMDSVDTVLELIANKSLYRGEEQKFVLEAFKKAKTDFELTPVDQKDFFVWISALSSPGAVTGIRNTAVGTLLVNLSNDMDLEEAVDKFGAMMDPRNYKRTTSLVTPKMVAAAREALDKEGLTPALERRHARLSDITPNDIIFVDREARKSMVGGDIFDQIATKKTVPKNLDRIDEVTIDQFLNDIVPKATSIEIMVENKHAPNLVSLIAPQHKEAKPLFKWGNGFSWTYNGEVTDSIKEKVKKAGGNVTGDLCCRLAWYNNDDLDFHMIEPAPRQGRKYEIMYTNKRRLSPAGGMLDVDMNGGDGLAKDRQPVENIYYAHRSRMVEGTYELIVHQFSKRENIDLGFEVEIDYLGEVHRFIYDKAVTQGARVIVCKFEYTHKDGFKIVDSIKQSTVRNSKELWGVPTQDFHRVSTVMLSPNYWGDGGGVGNKHFFFMLEGCRVQEETRGFFNEFLRDDLKDHRKVIELVGAKMKVEPTTDQLSGLGFSSTQRNELLARVKGSFTRTVKVVF